MKEIKHGGIISLRIPKDFPQDVLELINIIRDGGGGQYNQKMLQFLISGAREEVEPKDESISIYIEGLGAEEKKRIESNKELMALIRAIIKASLEKGY